MPKLLALAMVGSLLAGCASVGPQASTECFHANAPIEQDIGFCHAVRSGDTLYISGTVGQGDMPAAVRQAYDGLQKTLKARGLSFQNVVKETVFTTDLDAFIQHKEIRKGYYGPALPAATWVQVSRLYLPSFVVEVELTAQYPK
jgi:enamine deaminase RidA (YjgF/YER057c/UK114 family)